MFVRCAWHQPICRRHSEASHSRLTHQMTLQHTKMKSLGISIAMVHFSKRHELMFGILNVKQKTCKLGEASVPVPSVNRGGWRISPLRPTRLRFTTLQPESADQNMSKLSSRTSRRWGFPHRYSAPGEIHTGKGAEEAEGCHLWIPGVIIDHCITHLSC